MDYSLGNIAIKYPFLVTVLLNKGEMERVIDWLTDRQYPYIIGSKLFAFRSEVEWSRMESFHSDYMSYTIQSLMCFRFQHGSHAIMFKLSV
jgi:phage gp46-like protein